MAINSVAPNILWMFGGIFSLLVMATGLTSLLDHMKPQLDLSEIRLRIRSWWIMVAIFSLALTISYTISLLFFAAMSFLALKEYLGLIPARRVDRKIFYLAYAAIPIQYLWVGMAWYGMFIIFVPVYLFLLLTACTMLMGKTEGFLKAVGSLQWGLMLTVFSLSHAAYLLVLPSAGNPISGGAGLLLFLVFLTQSNDVLQFIWGKALGCHKVVPTISPNKTWEGLLGGVATTTTLSFVISRWLTPFTPLESIAIGLLIGVAGFVGDVVISAIKRDLDIKDCSQLIPGHGGILDRVDSLIYTAPLFFHVVYYFHY